MDDDYVNGEHVNVLARKLFGYMRDHHRKARRGRRQLEASSCAIGLPARGGAGFHRSAEGRDVSRSERVNVMTTGNPCRDNHSCTTER